MGNSQIPPFVVELPKGWDNRTVYVFMGPDDSGVQHMIQLVVDPDTAGADLADFARMRIEAALEQLQGTEVLKDEAITLGNGTAAHECIYKWIPVDNTVIYKRNLYMILDGTGYTFSGNFSKKTLQTRGVEMDRIVESFRPLDA
jgi:hypothetical protein